MSLLAIAMDLFLAALMISALVMGVRLNGRLKALKQSHEGFARAIVELNDAAVRAEKGLSGLREAATETHDSLLARIETARSLSAKLDGQIHAARSMLESDELVRSARARSAPAMVDDDTLELQTQPGQPPEALRKLAERFGLIPGGRSGPRTAPRTSSERASAWEDRAPEPRARDHRPDRAAPPASRESARDSVRKPTRRPAPGEDDLFAPTDAVPSGAGRNTERDDAGGFADRWVPSQTTMEPITPRPPEAEPAVSDFAARIRARKVAL